MTYQRTVYSGSGGGGTTYSADETTLHLATTTFSIKAGGVTTTEIADGTIVNADISATAAIAASKISGTAATHAENLSVFAATTSAQLAGVLSDETGTGAAVFANSPALVTPTGIVKADVGLGNVANASLATILGGYTSVISENGRGSTSAVNGTKYGLTPTTSDVSLAVTLGGSNAQQLALYPIAAADYAVTGATAKMRVVALCEVAGTPPAITITVGLYPITVSGSSWSGGTVVTGSTVAFTTPSANTINSANSGDFSLPSDGNYTLGYVVSGTPSAGFVIHTSLQVHYV